MSVFELPTSRAERGTIKRIALRSRAVRQFESARVGDHSARLGKGGGVTDRLFLICAACLLLPKSDPLRRALILNVTGSDEGCTAGGRQQRRRIKGRSPSLIAPSPRRGFESARVGSNNLELLICFICSSMIEFFTRIVAEDCDEKTNLQYA